MRIPSLMIAVAVVGCLGRQLTAADPITWLPSEVNAVARVNVADIYKTPLAKKEGWIKKATESFVNQEALIPPGTSQIVMGAELDLSDNLMANRKFAVLVPEGKTTLESLAGFFPGGVETVSGKTVAKFGNDGFVADAGDGCWLTTSSSRQQLSRWLAMGPTKNGAQLSQYLKTALNSKTNKAQVVMAIDLQDNFSQQRIMDELKNQPWFKTPTQMETSAKVLASVQGITISVTIDEGRMGSAVLDFEKDPMVLKPFLDKFVAGVLHRVGASNDDFIEWTWDVKDNQVIGSGPISPGGTRGLLSVLDPPSIMHTLSASAAPAPLTEEERMAKTSLKYCSSIRVLLDDLRGTLKKNNDNQTLYIERYARKIDDLPRLHVDDQLLDFAGKVSSSPRYQSQTQRMHYINAGTRTMQTYASASTYVGPYGWSSYTPNAGQQNVIAAEENQASKSVRFSEWKQIEDGLVTVRRNMTEKYQIEF